MAGALPWRQGEWVRALGTSRDYPRTTERGCRGEGREGSGHDGRCSGLGIGNASNRAPEERSWDQGIAVRWAREGSSLAAERLEPIVRCPGFDREHQRWDGHGDGFSSLQGAGGPYRGREILEGLESERYPGTIGPLKLATRIPSPRTGSAGANRAGSSQRPNSPSWCTSRPPREALP